MKFSDRVPLNIVTDICVWVDILLVYLPLMINMINCFLNHFAQICVVGMDRSDVKC